MMGGSVKQTGMPYQLPKEQWVTVKPGEKYGRLTVLEIARLKRGSSKYPQIFARCQCECGSPEKWIYVGTIRTGNARSCGCLLREIISRPSKHGESFSRGTTREYRAWTNMLSRCRNPKAAGYERYGGRGISVCERWLDYVNFLEDMGRSPSREHQIERLDNDANYSPQNCIWVTRAEQCRNRKSNRFFTFNGKTMCMKDWSKTIGIRPATLKRRIDGLGWPIEKALTAPIQERTA